MPWLIGATWGVRYRRPVTPTDVDRALTEHGYLPDEGLATAIFLALSLKRPLLLEGEAGVGKTEVAKVLATWTGGELIRLQCYEGIDAAQAVYDWDYAAPAAPPPGRRGEWRDRGADGRRPRSRSVPGAVPGQAGAAAGDRAPRGTTAGAADRRDRPGRRRVRGLPPRGARPTSRSRCPSSGCSRRSRPPIVILTSNRTRDVHDALEASLPLPLGRASRVRARGRDRAAPGAGGRPGARPSGGGGGRGAPRHEALQAAGCRRDDRLGDRARPARRDAGSTSAASSPPSARS